MEWVELALQLGFTPLNMVLGGMLYLVLANQGMVPKFWESGEEKSEVTPIWASKLERYFNHDTTAQHSATHEKLEKLIEMEEKEHEQAERFRDTLKDIGNTLANIEKYGITCREK